MAMGVEIRVALTALARFRWRVVGEAYTNAGRDEISRRRCLTPVVPLEAYILYDHLPVYLMFLFAAVSKT